MMLLVSGTTRSVAKLSGNSRIGCLLTPSNGNAVDTVVATGLPWAIDNGAFSGFDPEAFTKLAARAIGQPRLLFVVCPDVVGNAAATRFIFEEWSGLLRCGRLPVAFVGQDGQESLPVPWDDFSAFFIGGSTEWKLSDHAAELAAEAKQIVNDEPHLRHGVGFKCDGLHASTRISIVKSLHDAENHLCFFCISAIVNIPSAYREDPHK